MDIRIALAQINPTLGDIFANTEKIRESIHQARERGASVIAFPELSISGYPPEDLLLHPDFIQKQEEALSAIASDVGSFLVIVGYARPRDPLLYNSAALLNRGKILDTYDKIFLPNYGVFDEKRYFTPGNRVIVLDGQRFTLGVNICEDIWIPDAVTETQGLAGGAELVLNISSSPYHKGKWEERREMVAIRARSIQGYIAYVNLVGGQDELVFDGRSFVMDPDGTLLAKGKLFQEEIVYADISPGHARGLRLSKEFASGRSGFQPRWPLERIDMEIESISSLPSPDTRPVRDAYDPEEEVYSALVTGTRDYIRKNGFTDVVIGISGGIDSALVTAVAADVLDSCRVHGVTLPSPYTSDESNEDAARLCENLKIDLTTIPISSPFASLKEVLEPVFQDLPEDITEENLQARIRGLILMAISNKFGHLVLTTGNKSEISVGYSTLYGDTAGGFAVIKDVYKTMVYRLARWRNRKAGFDLIPSRILEKAPSAELKPDQTDQDTLPPYEVLDSILKAYIEQRTPLAKLKGPDVDEELIQRVIRMVERAEYKRRQSPPGIKITPTAFGKDRRMPITNRFI